MTKLIISNKEMNDFLKVIKSLKNVGLLIKDFRVTFENEPKE